MRCPRGITPLANSCFLERTFWPTIAPAPELGTLGCLKSDIQPRVVIRMAPAHEAARISSAALPTIDVAALASAKLADRQAVAERSRQACLHNGFFYISNHGIPDALVAEVFAETKSFFALPLDAKLAVDKARSRANRGYEKLQGQT